MQQLVGLSESEVLSRRQRGEGNNVILEHSRSYTDIIRSNLFTFFNNILFIIGILLISLGQYTDALTSVGLGVLNAFISTIQEIRSKRKLDRIALLTRPTVTVLRDGTKKTIDPTELVKGDIIYVTSGDQMMVDGQVVGAGKLEIDESLLTGEPDLVRKKEGDTLYSGSFCVTGHAYYEAEKVGLDSFAQQLTASARQFQLVATPLQKQINLVVRVVMLLALLISMVYIIIGILSIKELQFVRVVQVAAVLTGLVPYGLFLMIVVAYAMGAAKISDQGALVQQTNAIESLSNVDVLCMDKTGTLTANRLIYNRVEVVGDIPLANVQKWLGDFAHSVTENNKTNHAIANALSGTTHPLLDEVPFASVRKWSAVAFSEGVFVLGAVEMLKPYLPATATQSTALLMKKIQILSTTGLRVLLFTYNPSVTTLHNEKGESQLPELQPLGIVVLSDELRPQAKETLEAFAKLGIGLKIISGDNPHTVAALAKQIGLPNAKLISGAELENLSDGEFEQTAEETTIFGRISPEQKEKLVDALTKRGHYVAMMGDGVNDVLSLKKAKLGIAMQSGSNATRNVADMVLLNDSFAALQPAFTEGKRIVGGMSKVLYLFLVRVVTSAMVIIAIAMIGLSFPFEPAQLALTIFTVGIPTFFLTLWARPQAVNSNLLPLLVRFVMPASIVTMIIGISIYAFHYTRVVEGVNEFRIRPQVIEHFENFTGLEYAADDGFGDTSATLVAQTHLSIFISYTAFILIFFLEPPIQFFTGWTKLSPDKRPALLAIVLAIAFTIVIEAPTLSTYFGLIPAARPTYMTLLIALPLWIFIVRTIWRGYWFERFLGMES